ncbi:glycosyltransferase [Pantoea stewartii]|uniref:glycosyltransferase n=1 Tax=Pantoea stewartii TaxID=66269 RepID=UPI00345C4871
MDIKFLPIVVLYKIGLSHSDSINSILDSDVERLISEIFVYDNSPACEDNNEIIESYRGRKVYYINDYSNSGVSAAYNKGLSKAKELNYEYVLLLDQDTKFPPDSVKEYVKAIKNNPHIKLVAPRLKTTKGELCSPLRYSLHRGFVLKEIEPGIYPLDRYSPINSGMMLNTSSAIQCGGYEEKVFLDFSDFQFIEKLKRNVDCFYVMPLLVIQDLSNDEPDTNSLLNRFKIYCKCARNCHRNNFIDDGIYFFMVLNRAIKLTLRTKEKQFILYFSRFYVRGQR